MSTDLFGRAVEALRGLSRAEIGEALGLGNPGTDRASRVTDLLTGRRPARAGHVLDLAELIHQRAEAMMEEAKALDAEVLPEVGGLHGLTPQMLDYVGHVTSHEVVMHGPAWLTTYTHPAEVLRRRSAVALADGAGDMRPLAAARMRRALAALTDAQAVEVGQAAADVTDMSPEVPPA